MAQRIAITGLGIISAIGDNVQQNLSSLRTKKSGIGSIQYLQTIHKELPIAEVKHSDAELLKLAGIKEDSGYTRTALLGMIAAREAFENSGGNNNGGKRTALISATTVGGMGSTEKFYLDYIDLSKSGDFEKYVDAHDCGDSAEKIADSLGIKDFITSINTACSSSANALMLGARLIRHGIVDRVVAGGVDPLTKFTINGFNTLMILDKEYCKPFDKNRTGLTLGEGAGFVVLEKLEDAQRESKTVYCELAGYANTCDAYHQTASSPEGTGAFLSMSKALALSGLKPENIDYVNVHGTATQINDLSEGNAMIRLFEGNVPKFSSTKSYTGHTLGAAGGIEAVFSALAIHHNIIFPNLNFSEKMEEFNLVPVTEVIENAGVKNVLSNSFGFGGNNTSLVFSKI
ncbi:MAG: 3-oxoacyl-[acyl-carrier-protein] synthase 2 [Bacteroidia bacterium]|nr:3-oxoacyl-[acyl-carrier-protein] synthase 2 [Bacteroidia bacterium]